MGVHIDEAWRDGEPGDIDLLPPAAARHAADRGYAVAGDGDVGADGGRAGAVEHAAAAQDEIVGGHHAAHALAATASTSTNSPGRASALMTSKVEAGAAPPGCRARTLPQAPPPPAPGREIVHLSRVSPPPAAAGRTALPVRPPCSAPAPHAARP